MKNKKKLFTKTLVLFSITMALSGCQTLQDQAANLRKQSESALQSASQQADNIKKQAIETKLKFDEKSQQLINAADAINKLTK